MTDASKPVPESAPPPATVGDASPGTEKRGWLLSAGSLVLAFLASQHHTVMMVALAVGLGDAAMGPMTAEPAVRRVMLGISLAMAAVIAWRIRDPRRPRPMRVTGALAIIATLALAAWTVARFGP